MSAATYSLSPFGRAGGSYLAPDLIVRGRIETSGSVEMDCEFHGDVLAHQASVGPNGRIRARISADEATVSGEMSGIVTARQAFFRDGCHFRGEVEYESLGTEPNAEVDARLVPVMAGSSSLAIPTVRTLTEQPTLQSPSPRPTTTAPRVNMSMLAFLGGMVVAGIVTGILVVNPTTRSWKDQLLEQVMQPRPDAVPAAPVAVATPVPSAAPTEEPRITPPPPPAIPPSLSQILPVPAGKDPTSPATETLETRPAPATPVTATPATAALAPALVAPVIPDLSPTPPLPRHEPVDRIPAVSAETIPASPAPTPAMQETAPTAPQVPPATPVAATPTPDSKTETAPPAAPAATAPATPVAAQGTPPALPVTAIPTVKADPPAEPTKTMSLVPDQAKESKTPPAVTAPPAQTPVPAAAKKPKPALPAGARGALQEVCSWELKCDSDNQCVSVRSCKMQ